jgi:hypothetical protein
MGSRTYIDKSTWPRGPWNLEPDEVRWVDAATRLRCRASRGPDSGHWCGYVQVPSGHPWEGEDLAHADVHGGVTFTGSFAVYDEKSGPSTWDEWPLAYTPDSPKAPDQTNPTWVGFDCAHLGDRCPGRESLSLALGLPPLTDTGEYRTLEYVRDECARLAQQIKDNALWRNR